MKSNQKIRDAIAKMGLKYWQVADAIGISYNTFIVWMRHELTGGKLKRVQDALDELGKDGATV